MDVHRRAATRGLVVDHGGRRVLRGIELDAAAGRLTAVIGADGSSRTTRMRALAGEMAHGGTVRLNGLDPSLAHRLERARIRAALPRATPLAFSVLFTAPGGRASRTGGAARLGPRRDGRVRGRGPRRLRRPHPPRASGRRAAARRSAIRWRTACRAGSFDEAVAGLHIAHRLQLTEGARWFVARENGVVAVIHALNLTVMFADRGVRVAGGCVAGVMTNEAPGRAHGRALRGNVAPHRGIPALSDATGGQDA